MSIRQGTKQTRHEISPFFGSHGGAELFTKLFIETSPNYIVSINESDPTNISNIPAAYNLMKAEDYSNKQPGESNNDVHCDFTDFIIQSALFLREIDQPTGRGFYRSDEFRNLIRAQITDPNTRTSVLGTVINNDQIFGVASGDTGYDQRNLRGILAFPGGFNQSNAVKLNTVLTMMASSPAGINYLSSTINNLVDGIPGANNGLMYFIRNNPFIINQLNIYSNRIPGSNIDIFKQAFYNNVSNNIKAYLFQYANSLREEIAKYRTPRALRDNIARNPEFVTRLSQGIEDSILQALDDVYKTYAPQPTVAAGKSESAKLIENVYGKWNSLSDDARNFYKKFIQLQRFDPTTKTWTTVPETEYGTPIDPRNLSLYRINVIKTSLGTNIPAFVNLIPKFTKKNNLFNDIWYTDSTGKCVRISTSDWTEDSSQNSANNFFKNLYTAVYNGQNRVPVSTTRGVINVPINPPNKFNPNVTTQMFNLNVDQYIRKRFFTIQQELKKPPVVTGPILSLTDKNIWKVDEQGRLYLDEPSGRVYYGIGDPASDKVFKDNFKCYSTFANVQGAECNRYITECLLNNNPDEISVCAEMWRRGDFYKISKEEIKNMHPLVAIRTLQKFGFRNRPVYDPELKMEIKKVESVENWIKDVLSKAWGQKKTNDGRTLQSILESNENVLNYLKLIVEYVNSNPAILNGKEFVGKTVEAVGKVPRSEYAKKLQIPMIKEPKGPATTFYDYSMLRSHLDSGFLGRNLRKPFSTFGTTHPIGMQGVVGLQTPTFRSPFTSVVYGLNVPFQMGGLHPDIQNYLHAEKTGIISGAESLYHIINVTLEDLKAMGKTIDPNDLKSIENKVNAMKALEFELVKTETYLEEYKYLIELFKDYKSEILTLDTIKNLVEKKKDLLSRQTSEENILLKILGSLQGLRHGKCDDFIEDPCQYKPITVDVDMSQLLTKPKETVDCIPKQKICPES